MLLSCSRKETPFCSLKCLYFKTAYKNGVENYKVKALATFQFPVVPFKLFTNISYPLKKTQTALDRLNEQQTPADKVLAETHTHCMLVTSGWSSIEPFSSSSCCCHSTTLCERKMLRYLFPGEVVEVRSLSRQNKSSPVLWAERSDLSLVSPWGWLALGSCMANFDGSFYDIPLSRGKWIIFFFLGRGGLSDLE